LESTAFPLLRAIASSERMEPYVIACGGDQAAAVRLYAWNIRVSAAFHGPLGCLEVACRNAMHYQLAGLFGREDWWDAASLQLHYSGQRTVAYAKQEVQRRHGAMSAGRMVAELPFGFWVSLLGSGADYETRLWRPTLHLAFPGYRGRRAVLHLELDASRRLRNRIAHHEPIHKRDLSADHARIMRLLGYVSWDYATWVQAHDRVREVLAARQEISGKDHVIGY
jgi:hypothetical protein